MSNKFGSYFLKEEPLPLLCIALIMRGMAATSEQNNVSRELIVYEIQSIRDSHIRELLRDPVLMDFLEKNFEVFGLSQVKKEFLKRELTELRSTSLDLAHYATLIKQTRESNDPVSYDHPLFRAELNSIFQRYV